MKADIYKNILIPSKLICSNTEELVNAILLLLFLGIMVWFWQNNLRFRERAINSCRRICRELNIQLLDQTISLASISIEKDQNHRLQLKRRYMFEVSADGATRHKGYIIMLGHHVIHTEIDLPDGPLILHRNDLINYH